MSSLWTRGRGPATISRFAPLAHTVVAAANGVGQVRDTTRAGQDAEDSAHAQSVPALQHAACPSRPSQSHASHGRGSSPAPFWSSSALLGRAHGRSSDSGGGMKPCLRSLIALRTKRLLSGSFQGDSEAAASALSSVTTTAKVLNEGLDPMASLCMPTPCCGGALESPRHFPSLPPCPPYFLREGDGRCATLSSCLCVDFIDSRVRSLTSGGACVVLLSLPLSGIYVHVCICCLCFCFLSSKCSLGLDFNCAGDRSIRRQFVTKGISGAAGSDPKKTGREFVRHRGRHLCDRRRQDSTGRLSETGCQRRWPHLKVQSPSKSAPPSPSCPPDCLPSHGQLI